MVVLQFENLFAVCCLLFAVCCLLFARWFLVFLLIILWQRKKKDKILVSSGDIERKKELKSGCLGG